MRSALYYPYTSVQSESLVKTALLLWDRLECIVPRDHFQPHHQNRNIARAMELIGGRHIPNEEEKHDAHDRLKDVLNRRLPQQFFINRRQSSESLYDIYPEKFLPESWDLFRKARISGLDRSNYSMTEFSALMIMSVLADSCAGTTRSRITDRGEAYATLAACFGNRSKAPTLTKSDTSEKLVPIALKLINTPSLSLKDLIEWREREQKEAGRSLRDLRHRYVDSIESYLGKMSSEKTTERDAKEIARHFSDDMEADLRDLKKELGFASREAVLSKEIIVTVAAAAGTVASFLLGSPLHLDGIIEASGGGLVTVGGLLATGNKYRKARHEILKKHPMAYLYEARH